MKLSAYLIEERLTQTQFARIVGASQVQVCMWVNGKAWPTQAMVIEIYNATSGKVTPNDFLPDDVIKKDDKK
jgi:transcriptional regulator with XRE-family HTH domain